METFEDKPGPGPAAVSMHEPIAIEDDPDEPKPTNGEAEEVDPEDLDTGANASHYMLMPEPDSGNRPPDWFPKTSIPPAPFKFPRGLDVVFVRLRASLTAQKGKGDRFLICWELSDGDERLAFGRGMADPQRAGVELAKQMIRSVDGSIVTWDGLPGPGNPDQLWKAIGAKGRRQILGLYTQLHVPDRMEQIDFFANCVGRVRTG